MGKTKNTGTIIAIISSVVGIILIILTWPRLNLQTNFGGGQNDFTMHYPNTAELTVSVWNRGGSISDWRIIAPESCVSAIVTGNVTCSHESFSGAIPCNMSVCGPTLAQSSGPIDKMSLKINEPYPNNFTINLYALSSFSIINIASMNASYTCLLNNKPSSNSYTCS